MSAVWLGLTGILLVTVATKAAGALLGPESLSERALAVVALLAPALLAGLVIADVAGRSWDDVDPAVLAGLAVAAGLRTRVGGIVVPLVTAAAVTAAVRALT